VHFLEFVFFGCDPGRRRELVYVVNKHLETMKDKINNTSKRSSFFQVPAICRRRQMLPLTILSIIMCWVYVKQDYENLQPHQQQQQQQTKKDDTPPKVVYYSATRQDRSGAAIQDMLACHAYAYHHNATYGGACGNSPFVKDHQVLIDTLGLTDILPFACPPKDDPRHVLVNIADYLLKPDTSLWTPDWQRIVRHHVAKAIPNPNSNENKCRIAVHIRRGDVNPCCAQNRYTPNSLYLELLKEYYNHNDKCQVEIYSQSKSFEPFDEFSSEGYSFQLDGDPMEAIKALLTANVAILSKSSFSLVAAVLRDQSVGKVVYTPFWHAPLKGWDYVPVPLIKDMNQRVKQLRNQNCTAAAKRAACDAPTN
jgi:hypothetical protein